MKKVKGYEGSRNNLIRAAKQAATRAGKHAFHGRKQKKRDKRRLWTVRINAGLRQLGTTYSQFMGMFRKKGLELNRKMLSELAAEKPKVFENIVEFVQE